MKQTVPSHTEGRKPYEAPAITSYSSDQLLTELGPAAALYP